MHQGGDKIAGSRRCSNYEDGAESTVSMFADMLEIGCSLACIREETRLQALEATEQMIAMDTWHRFRISEELVQQFSVREVVIFKDLENVPAKTKTQTKDPFKARNVLGVIKERRALNFYQMEWKKSRRNQVSTFYAGPMKKYLELTLSGTDKNSTSSLTQQEIADEVACFASLFRLKQKNNQQKKDIVLKDRDECMQELRLTLDAGVAASILSAAAGNCEDTRRQSQ